jgi:hypothetical protein
MTYGFVYENIYVYMCMCFARIFCIDFVVYFLFRAEMDIRDLRAWMYDRKARKYLTPEFLNGVEHFVDVAIQYSASINESLIRCPCKR